MVKRGTDLKILKVNNKKYFSSKKRLSLVATPYYFCFFNHDLQHFFPQTTSAESCKT